jgi:hypothetical protein
VVHERREVRRLNDKTAKPFQRKLTSRSDVKARSAVLKLKKRHVKWRRAFQQKTYGNCFVGPSL